MSLPNEIDFALIKIGDGGGTEVFAVLCGIDNVTINEGATSNDRFVRDCAKPGAVPYRLTKVSGRQLDITGSGLTNATMVPALRAAIGALKNYRIETYREDGSDAGVLLGTYSGSFRLTSFNQTLSLGGDASSEVTLASHGQWTYAAAA